MVLIIKHIDIEGPETIGAFFRKNGFSLKILELYAGDRLPADLADIEAVISLGGPMNVYEEDKYPFLKAEDAFIREVLARKIPFIGICLGAQLLAKAAEAKVTRSPQKEVGFFPVQLTSSGMADPLFENVPAPLDVYQWHEDMFAVPPEGTLLASSQGCPHQAFRVGPCAYGLQFHVEITDKSIREWSDKYFPEDDPVLSAQKEAMLSDYIKKKEQFDRVADTIYGNFLRIITQNNAQ